MNDSQALRDALAAWDRYSVDMPDLAWVGSDLEFLLLLAQRSESGEGLNLSEREQERLTELAPEGQPGRLGGLAVRDVSDADASELLCEAQAIARKMLRNLKRSL